MKNLLREKRLELYPNLSIRDFCVSAGVPTSTYQKWESGYCASTKDSNFGNLRKIASVLEVSIEELNDAISNNYKARKDGNMPKLHNGHTRSNNSCLGVWRVENGLTQRDMADLLNVSIGTYNGYENGKYRPSKETLIAITELTGLSMHQIAQIYVDAHKTIDPEKDILIMDVYDDETVAPESTDPVYDEDYFEAMDGEVITAYDGNGKAIAGRYPLQLSADDILVDKALHELYGKLTCEEYNRIKDILGGALI